MTRRTLVLAAWIAVCAAACATVCAIGASPGRADEAGLRFDRFGLNTGGSTAEACLRFDRDLDDQRGPSYADHITLTPAAKPSVRVQGRSLCLGGLAFDTRYTVNVSPGLTSRDGTRLDEPLSLTLSLGDRNPAVAIAGSGYILPRRAATGLEIQTVNVAHVRVRLWRMSESSAARLSRGDGDYGQRVDLAATSLSRYQLDRLRDRQLVPVWTGTMDVDAPRNATATTAFPIAGLIDGQRAGLYLVTASEAARRRADTDDLRHDGETDDDGDAGDFAAHWVDVSDIGLTTIRGTDGLHVFARSLATAQPLPGIAVRLTATGGDILGEASTDKTGALVFAPGLVHGRKAEAPASLTARGPAGDFAMLALDHAWFDFSDRGVEGRPPPGPQQALVVADRGVYRPGESVHVTALLRDAFGRAIVDQPLILVLRRPDGVEDRRLVLPPKPGPDGGASGNGTGGFVVALALRDSASIGGWRLQAYADPTAEPIGTASFEVQDFVPQTLAVTLTSPGPSLTPGQPAPLTLTGRYLYGAPAAGLHGEAKVRVLADPNPVPSLRGYSFGLVDQSLPGDEQTVEVPDADAQGVSHPVLAPRIPSGLSLPMKAEVAGALLDPAGRSVTAALTLKVHRGRPLLGLKVGDVGGGSEQRAAPVTIAAIAPDDRPMALGGLAWSVVRENEVYDWIRDSSGWGFHRHVVDEPVASGTIATGADGLAHLAPRLYAGGYRVIVSDPNSGAASSARFHVGWWSHATDNDAPDRLQVTARATSLVPGATTTVHVEAPFAGEGQLVIASDRVFEIRSFHLPKGGADLPVAAAAGWQNGAYAIATAYRPLDQPARPHEPSRAVGLAWIGLDQSPHRLDVHVDAPPVVRPQQRLTLPVHVAPVHVAQVHVGGAHAGAPVHLTLAAVDEGVLAITDYRLPDLFGQLFGRWRLGIDLLDTYARLLAGTAPPGRLHQGGDEGGGATGLPVTTTRTVSLFSGDVALDAQGNGRVVLDVPDFEGTLRLMAIAWSADAVGTASTDSIVRDPVFADVTLPRFLSPGDRAGSLVSLADTDGPAGTYTVQLAASGAVSAEGETRFSAALLPGQRRQFPATLRAGDSGTGHLTASLADPAGHVVLTRRWDIAVRPAHLPLTQSTVTRQDPGQSYTAPADLLAGFEPGSSAATFGYSAVGGIDTIGLLQSVESQAWGDSESRVAASWPLLRFKGHELLGRVTIPGGPEKRVRQTIDTLLDREDPGGRIGDWHLNDGGTLPWTQIYLVDFLLHARQAGFAVPDAALDRALDWLETSQLQGGIHASSDTAVTPESRAYALYVLSMAGRPVAPALRAMRDDLVPRTTDGKRMLVWGSQGARATMADALALGHLAVGFAGADMRPDSNELFGMAVDALGPPRSGRPGFGDWGYWVYVRDLSGLVPLAADSGNRGLAQTLVDRFNDLTLTPPWLSDIEKAGLLEAGAAMDRDDPARAIAVSGKPLPLPVHLPVAFSPDPAHVAGYRLANTGRAPLWLSVTVTGTPRTAPPPQSSGFSLSVSTRTIDGQPFDTAHLRQNDRFVVEIEGAADDDDLHHVLIVDMLPAGWEIEGQDGPPFLRHVSATRSVSLQDDRYVAALDLHGRERARLSDQDDKPGDAPRLRGREFRVAYIVRAVTPGHFTRPETVVFDRYRPTLTARTAAASLDIAPR